MVFVLSRRDKIHEHALCIEIEGKWSNLAIWNSL